MPRPFLFAHLVPSGRFPSFVSGIKILARSGFVLYLSIFAAYKIVVNDNILILKALNELAPPMKPLALLHEGQNSLSAKDLQPYVDYFASILSYVSHSPSASLALGFCHEHLGDREEALKDFRASVQEIPENFWGQYNIGRLLYLRGDYDKAAEAFETALKIPAEKAVQFIFFSKITKDITLALPEARKNLHIRLAEGYQNALLLKALSYYHLKKFDLMAQACAAALSASNLKKNIWFFYSGVAFFELKNYNDAAALFNKYDQISPGDGAVYDYLAQCAETLGRKETSLQLQKKALAFPRREWMTTPWFLRMAPEIF